MTMDTLSETRDGAMISGSPVAIDVQYAIEQFYYGEARMLDQERLREWLDTALDPAIRYRMVIRDDRYARDKSPDSEREVMIYDDDLTALDLRVRQFETGLQRMMDPRQRIRRFVSNVQVAAAADREFEVVSYGKAYRFRREYDKDEVIYERTDVLRRDERGAFRIVRRRIDLFERVIRSKNLLFFL